MRAFVLPLLLSSSLVACGGEPTLRAHVNALSGEACEPDDTYEPRDPDAPDPHVDCTGHDDVEPAPEGPCCTFPQPGCDEHGCCDDDIVVDPDGDDDDGDDDEADEETPEDEGPIVI